MQPLVLATHNAQKVAEFQQMFNAASLDWIELRGFDGPAPIESGSTFEQNALLKAKAASLHTGMPAFADDSGLAVDIMGGSPGIFSARWAGSGADDTSNRRLLLEQLADVPEGMRTARFVCALAIVVPRRESEADSPVELAVRGEWNGSIAFSERGKHGFGYDPVFLPGGGDLTAAELDPDVKNALSHRARAWQLLSGALVELLS